MANRKGLTEAEYQKKLAKAKKEVPNGDFKNGGFHKAKVRGTNVETSRWITPTAAEMKAANKKRK